MIPREYVIFSKIKSKTIRTPKMSSDPAQNIMRNIVPYSAIYHIVKWLNCIKKYTYKYIIIINIIIIILQYKLHIPILICCTLVHTKMFNI